jgi:hypothetical protein
MLFFVMVMMVTIWVITPCSFMGKTGVSRNLHLSGLKTYRFSEIYTLSIVRVEDR